jgi:diguanylate cyclase (GGDEF)-like protein
VGDRIQAAVRPTDVPARLGGDEFAVAAPVDDLEQAEALMERLIRSINEPIFWRGRLVTVGASAGAVLAQPGTAVAEDVLRAADLAMYAAKKRGKNQHHVRIPSPRQPSSAQPVPAARAGLPAVGTH